MEFSIGFNKSPGGIDQSGNHNVNNDADVPKLKIHLGAINNGTATIEKTGETDLQYLEKKPEVKHELALNEISKKVRKSIGKEFLRQAKVESVKMDKSFSAEQITDNQYAWVNRKTNNGEPYIHDRDKTFLEVLDDPKKEIHTLLPGYATGDRYSLIFAALMEPRLHISIAYSEGNEHELKCAQEARQIITKALEVNGEKDPSSRISLLSYKKGENLKDARESLDSPGTRSNFAHQSGAQSPLSHKEKADDHLFHISVTTELIARYFQTENGMSKKEKHALVQKQLSALVNPEDQKKIDQLVDETMAEQHIKKNAVGLWVANREKANERESEAISRPAMFELMADTLESKEKPVYFIADDYSKRHPYRPTSPPDVGCFWQKEIKKEGGGEGKGEAILAPRENQWYFMDQLLTKTSGQLIGIRSGALEPFALMGHNIIYLEHKDMFTPERHASWQNIIPYHRLRTEHTTGYLKQETEVMRSELISELVSKNIVKKAGKQALPISEEMSTEEQELVIHEFLGKEPASLESQNNIGRISDNLREGVMSGRELSLLVEMVEKKGVTAVQAAKNLWPLPEVEMEMGMEKEKNI